MGFFKGNFTLIAENTTKTYLELKNRYSNSFDTDYSLLAVAGILDAQNYIFTSSPTIDAEEVFRLAKDSVTPDTPHTSLKAQIVFEKQMREYKDGKLSKADFLSGDENNSEKEISEVDNILFNFIFGLELLIFRADSPKLSPALIEEACRDKYKTIEKAIVHTMNKHKIGQGLIARATTSFMESPKFQPIRQQLGITQ